MGLKDPVGFMDSTCLLWASMGFTLGVIRFVFRCGLIGSIGFTVFVCFVGLIDFNGPLWCVWISLSSIVSLDIMCFVVHIGSHCSHWLQLSF